MWLNQNCQKTKVARMNVTIIQKTVSHAKQNALLFEKKTSKDFIISIFNRFSQPLITLKTCALCNCMSKNLIPQMGSKVNQISISHCKDGSSHQLDVPTTTWHAHRQGQHIMVSQRKLSGDNNCANPQKRLNKTTCKIYSLCVHYNAVMLTHYNYNSFFCQLRIKYF